LGLKRLALGRFAQVVPLLVTLKIRHHDDEIRIAVERQIRLSRIKGVLVTTVNLDPGRFPKRLVTPTNTMFQFCPDHACPNIISGKPLLLGLELTVESTFESPELEHGICRRHQAAFGTWPGSKFTVVTNTPLIREKPYLSLDSNSNFVVMVPNLNVTNRGTTWQTAQRQGVSIPISQFLSGTTGRG